MELGNPQLFYYVKLAFCRHLFQSIGSNIEIN